MHVLSTLFSVALLASTVLGQNTTGADAADLTAVDADYAELDLEAGGNEGFGINLTSTALLTVTYPRGRIVNGRTYPPARLGDQPDILITPSESFKVSATFTLTLADASALDDPDPEGNYRHWLANGLVAGEASGNGSFVPTGGVTVTDYVGPGPLAGSGLHRYAFLLFVEPDGFTPPANLSTAGTEASHWYVGDYVQQTGLQLAAAVVFLAENEDDGAPSGGGASGAGASSTEATAPVRTRTSIPLTASATAFVSSAN